MTVGGQRSAVVRQETEDGRRMPIGIAIAIGVRSDTDCDTENRLEI